MAGSYNPLNQGTMNAGSSNDNKGFYNKLLRGLSSMGMNYDDMIQRNTVGVGMNEDPMSQRNNSPFDYASARAVAHVMNEKSIPYLDKSYIDKRRILREYSIKDTIRDFVSIVADECIEYDENNFCTPKPLSNNYSDDIRNKYQEYFEKIYNSYKFSNNIAAYTMTKDFLIDGYLAEEIIWDDKKQNIIGFNRLKPETIIPAFEPSVGNLWIQYPEDPQLRRIFLDSQIIFISYTSQNDFNETSYVEGLIKPYNQLKLIEQTKIMFNIVNCSPYMKFVIPTKGLSNQRAQQEIGQMMSSYAELIEWDDTLGTVTINGSKHLPYNKQLWLPDGDNGTPNVELVSPTMTDLNEDTILKHFDGNLKRTSRIPYSRFNLESGGGNIYTIETSEISNEEQKFAKFVNRQRANIKELITKPLKLQMCIEFPELKDDKIFLNQVDVVFSTNQVTEKWKKIRTYAKLVETAQNLAGFLKVDGTPYFHPEFIMKRIIQIPVDELQENESFWIKERALGTNVAAGGEGGAPAGGDGGGGSPGGMPGMGAQGGAESGAQGGMPAQGGEAGGETPAQGGETPAQGGGGQAQKEFDF